MTARRDRTCPRWGSGVKLIVLDCTASLNVAVAVVDTATPVAPLAGVSLVTLGAAGSVVNDQENGPLIGIAVAILGTADRGGVGRVVGQGRAGGQRDRVVRAVVSDSSPAPDVPALGVKVKLIVLDCTASLNVAVAAVDTATFVAPLAGVSLVTAGCAASVVNDQENGALMGSPSVSLAPLTVAV